MCIFFLVDLSEVLLISNRDPCIQSDVSVTCKSRTLRAVNTGDEAFVSIKNLTVCRSSFTSTSN